jgi:uncharacterized protein (DUF1684 family)
MTSLEAFRAEKDTFFADDDQSPLSPGQKQSFQGLDYFPENPSLRIEVTVQEYPEKQEVQIQTSTGDVRYFERFGRFDFKVEGTPVFLTLYRNDMGYFLAFIDSLAGDETYPAGRYVEPEEIGEGKFLIDFNYAYNPYCAYSEYYSCPLTPAENRLHVPIRAGERIFEH